MSQRRGGKHLADANVAGAGDSQRSLTVLR
jgi:hypothetical protein